MMPPCSAHSSPRDRCVSIQFTSKQLAVVRALRFVPSHATCAEVDRGGWRKQRLSKPILRSSAAAQSCAGRWQAPTAASGLSFHPLPCLCFPILGSVPCEQRQAQAPAQAPVRETRAVDLQRSICGSKLPAQVIFK